MSPWLRQRLQEQALAAVRKRGISNVTITYTDDLIVLHKGDRSIAYEVGTCWYTGWDEAGAVSTRMSHLDAAAWLHGPDSTRPDRGEVIRSGLV